MDDEKPATPEEEREAAALAEFLDGKADRADVADRAAVEMVRASAGRASPLGEVAARRMAREAVLWSLRRRARRRFFATAVSAIAAAAIVVVVARAVAPRPPLPRELSSRSAGLLVPGPFPDEQTAAKRLDLVTNDRMVALREIRLRRARGKNE